MHKQSVAKIFGYIRSQLGVLLAIGMALIGLWGLFNLQGWFYVSAGLVIAGSLFYIRLRARWLYAIPEIGLGLFGLSRSVPIVTGGFSPDDFSAADFDVANVKIDVLISITAVYLIIRGLDNLLQGVCELRKP